MDLGRWWHEEDRIATAPGWKRDSPQPGAGADVQRRDALRESIQYALDHREEALAYAMQFARDLDPQLADKFVGMYVNERTLDYGPDGREAVRRLLDMGTRRGLFRTRRRVEFVE